MSHSSRVIALLFLPVHVEHLALGADEQRRDVASRVRWFLAPADYYASLRFYVLKTEVVLLFAFAFVYKGFASTTLCCCTVQSVQSITRPRSARVPTPVGARCSLSFPVLTPCATATVNACVLCKGMYHDHEYECKPPIEPYPTSHLEE